MNLNVTYAKHISIKYHQVAVKSIKSRGRNVPFYDNATILYHIILYNPIFITITLPLML